MKPTKEAVASQFGRNAENYAHSDGHARGSDLQIVLNLLAPNRRWHVLDIATGAGHTAALVAPHVHQVTAVDLAPEMIDQTRLLFDERGIENATARVMDVENLAFEDGTFDAVTCRIAPHHFIDIDRAIAEVARVLAPGGVFVMEDSCAPQDERLDQFINMVEKLRDPTHVRSLSESEWRELLMRSGFKIKKSRHYRKTHNIVEWMDKAGLPSKDRPAVMRMWRQASEAAREHFAIEHEAGEPVSYTDDKVIFRVVKSR